MSVVNLMATGGGVENGEYVPGVLVLDVLNGTSALDTADSETRGITKTANDTCLPLERADDGLVDLGGLVKVDHVDVSLGGRNNEQLVLDVHTVDAVLALQCADRLRALQVPELNCLVPGACRDVVLSAGLEPAHALDGLLVGLSLLCLYLAASSDIAEVDDVEVAGGVAGCYSCAVLYMC